MGCRHSGDDPTSYEINKKIVVIPTSLKLSRFFFTNQKKAAKAFLKKNCFEILKNYQHFISFKVKVNFLEFSQLCKTFISAIKVH